jgi:translation initiation factor 5
MNQIKLININNSNDPNYRYKMPCVNIITGGAGNGKFTLIKNINEIAESINTPPDIINKFISYTLGSAFNEKKNTITGHHNNIQDIIFQYINTFVMCKTCNIPELTYSLNKISSKKINLECRCSACGITNSIVSNNKIIDKCVDTIIKYLSKEGVWLISKGKMGQDKKEESSFLDEDFINDSDSD